MRLAAPDLPVHLTAFVGRVREIAQLDDLLDRERLVTLAGPGGCGKTRLAIEVARRRVERHNRIYFVDLSTVDDAAAVVVALAEHAAPSATTIGSLAQSIGEQALLVVLDNCEHLVDSSADVADRLLRACPNLVIVATSREPLGVGGEVTYRVASLSDEDAAVLFEERARRARPALRNRELELIPDICERLDGIPLAIELAAARIRVFSAVQIRDGLRDRFRMLTGGVRSAVARHQTLEASVDWSYDLLLETERALLRRLSIFAGGFTVAAAEAVGADGDIDRHHVLDLLTQLVDKSLVVTDDERFRLLETVRQYAALRLADAGESEAAWQRFYDHFVTFSRTEGDETEAAYTRRIRDDYENLRRALQWAAEQPDAAPLAVLAVEMTRYWSTSRVPSDGARWTALACERGADLDLRLRAGLTRAAADLRGLAGEWADAHALSLRAVELAREADNAKGLAIALAQAALHARNADVPGSDDLLDEALELSSSFDSSATRAYVLYAKAVVLVREDGDIDRGIALLEEALAVAVRSRSGPMERLCRGLLALTVAMRGEVAGAIDELELVLATMDAHRDGFAIADLYLALIVCHALTGDDAAVAEKLLDFGTVSAEMGGSTFSFELATAVAELFAGKWRPAADRLQSLLRSDELRSRHIQTALLGHRAMAELQAGDLAAAERCADAATALACWHPLGHPLPYLAAAIAAARGDLDAAEVHARAALSEVSGAVPAQLKLECLVLHALLAHRRGRRDDAVRIFAAAIAHANRVGASTTTALWRSWEQGELDVIRPDADAVESPLDFDEIVAYLQRGRGPRGRPSSGWTSLTPTEAQVIELVALGTTNKEIAERLFMSVPTVKSHLTHVYRKLAIANRAELAAEVAKRTILNGT